MLESFYPHCLKLGIILKSIKLAAGLYGWFIMLSVQNNY